MSAQGDIGLGLVQRYQVLQGELASLINYINDTRRMLGGLHDELPAATDALAEVTRVTETAAHNMIDLVEQIMEQDEAATDSLSKVKAACEKAGDEEALQAVEQVTSLSEQRTDLLIRMMTELSFQDLTCQTINQISTTVLEVERRVLKLIDATSDGSSKQTVEAEESLTVRAGVSRLRETQSGSSRQDMVDALLRGE